MDGQWVTFISHSFNETTYIITRTFLATLWFQLSVRYNCSLFHIFLISGLKDKPKLIQVFDSKVCCEIDWKILIRLFLFEIFYSRRSSKNKKWKKSFFESHNLKKRILILKMCNFAKCKLFWNCIFPICHACRNFCSKGCRSRFAELHRLSGKQIIWLGHTEQQSLSKTCKVRSQTLAFLLILYTM